MNSSTDNKGKFNISSMFLVKKNTNSYYKFVEVVSLCFLLMSNNQTAFGMIVGIGGPSGSGKTTFAYEIQKRFSNENILVISMDDYYYDLSNYNSDQIKEYNFDDQSAIDLDLLRKNLTQLKAGYPVKLPRYNFKTKVRTIDKNLTFPTQLIIVEGFLLTVVAEIYKLCDLKIFIDVEESECLLRMIERDQKDRNILLQDFKYHYKKHIKPCYDQKVYPSRYNANIIVTNTSDDNTCMEIITKLINTNLKKKNV